MDARYEIALSEQRIIIAALSLFKKDEQITHTKNYMIPLSYIQKLSGVASSQSFYQHAREAAFKLVEREVTIITAGDEASSVRWLQSVNYSTANGASLEIRFSREVILYLNFLKNKVTADRLKEAARLPSTHTMRLFTLFLQWWPKRLKEVEVGWLRSILVLEDKYSHFTDFHKRVIQPAIKQINEDTSLCLSYKTVKRGREISHFIFKLERKQLQKEICKPSAPTSLTSSPAYHLSLLEISQMKKEGEHELDTRKRLIRENWQPKS